MEYVMIILAFMGWAEHRCEYVAVTYSGNEYVIGSGDTCASALEGWVVPQDWRSIEVRQGWVWRSL